MSQPHRPEYPPAITANIPPELHPYRQWVTWELVWREGKAGRPGSWTKVPKNPATGANAESNNPATWGACTDVLGRFDRVGFVLTQNDPFCMIDVDGGRDPETGLIHDWALAVVKHFPSYWEVSPSGTGLKGLIRGRPPRNLIFPAGGGEGQQIEIFFAGKYTTLTGWRL